MMAKQSVADCPMAGAIHVRPSRSASPEVIDLFSVEIRFVFAVDSAPSRSDSPAACHPRLKALVRLDTRGCFSAEIGADDKTWALTARVEMAPNRSVSMSCAMSRRWWLERDGTKATEPATETRAPTDDDDDGGDDADSFLRDH